MSERQYAPVGIFDSGIGGVSTLGQAVHMLPHENFIYYGDNGNGPYSLRTEEQVRQYCLQACDYMVDMGAKAIVVACNSATVTAISEMRSGYDLPILGMEPAVKVAASFKPEGKIAIMATGMTLKSQMLSGLIERFAQGFAMEKVPCRDVITMIEDSVIDGPEMEKTIGRYFAHLEPKGISVVVFGCTHFGLLEGPVKNVLGDHIRIADGNEGTIRHLTNILKEAGQLNPGDRPQEEIVFHNTGTETALQNSIKNYERHLAYLRKTH